MSKRLRRFPMVLLFQSAGTEARVAEITICTVMFATGWVTLVLDPGPAWNALALGFMLQQNQTALSEEPRLDDPLSGDSRMTCLTSRRRLGTCVELPD